MNLRRLWTIARKEMVQLVRDKRMLPLVFVSPVIQLSLLGYAASYDLKAVRLGIVDEAKTQLSRHVTDAIRAPTNLFEPVQFASQPALEAAIIAGTVEAGVVFPPDLSSVSETGRAVPVAIWLNGSDTNRAQATRGALEVILQRESAALVPYVLREVGHDGAELDPPILLVPKIRFNPTLESRPFMVPGVLAMVLTIMTMILTAMAVVREKERGTIDQIAVSPIHASEWILGKMLPFIGVAMIDVVLVTAVAVFWFGIPLRGTLFDLFFVSAVYITSSLGLGLLVSTVSTTQQQAMLTALFLLLPLNLLSGIFYPVENMPQAIRAVAWLIPLRYYGVCVRAIFLKGAGLDVLWPQALGMAAIGTAVLSFAIVRSARSFR
ncbi:MAG TPA: ABC transporter permease [bacterium]|nr:ABC transporter permease [bacterium]